MIFTLFTGIVFIAEVIILITLIKNLISFDKSINKINDRIDKSKSKIEEIVKLTRKISVQLVELAPFWVEKLKWLRNKIIISKFRGVLLSMLLVSINIRLVQKLRKSKWCKLAIKGLSLIQDMV